MLPTAVGAAAAPLTVAMAAPHGQLPPGAALTQSPWAGARALTAGAAEQLTDAALAGMIPTALSAPFMPVNPAASAAHGWPAQRPAVQPPAARPDAVPQLRMLTGVCQAVSYVAAGGCGPGQLTSLRGLSRLPFAPPTPGHVSLGASSMH